MEHRIIVIDDEIDFLDSIKRGLTIAGYRNLHMVSDPQKALFLFKRGDVFDIALIDLSMPDLDGIELLEEIKKYSPDTLCIMVSAFSDAEFAVECMQKGACDYLVKPVTKETILLSITRGTHLKQQVEKRKQVETELKESEELHRITLSNISDAVFITDETGNFTFICPNVDFIFGFTAKEVTSKKNISALLGNDIFNYFKIETLTEVKNIEYQARDKEGNVHLLLVNIKKVSIKGGKILFTCRDVTEYHNMLKNQQEKDEMFRQLTEHINEVFWVTSVDYKEMIYISPAFETIWGRPCQALYEKPELWFDAIHDDDKKRVSNALEQSRKNGLDEKYRIIRPDKSIRMIRDRAFSLKNEEGKVYRFVGIAQDITDQGYL